MADLAWLTLPQAAAYVQLSARTLMRSLKRGDLIGYQVGIGARKSWRIRPADLDAFVMGATVPELYRPKDEEREQAGGPVAPVIRRAGEAQHANDSTAA